MSHTPFSCQKAVRTYRNATGKTSVPKSDNASDRTGRSTAVKNEEKHMSIQPTRYENENILIAVTLTFISSVSPSLMNIAATDGPAKNMKPNAITEVATEATSTRLKIAFILPNDLAPQQ